YLNSVPLSAPPGYGEVHGFGEALYTWFGLELADVGEALNAPEPTPEKVRAYKHVLALVVSLRAPTTYLLRSREALEEHADEYTSLLVEQGVIDEDFARKVRAMPLTFLPHAPLPQPRTFVDRKASNAVRTSLLRLLDVPGFYDLDRLDLAVDTTIDIA